MRASALRGPGSQSKPGSPVQAPDSYNYAVLPQGGCGVVAGFDSRLRIGSVLLADVPRWGATMEFTTHGTVSRLRQWARRLIDQGSLALTAHQAADWTARRVSPQAEAQSWCNPLVKNDHMTMRLGRLPSECIQAAGNGIDRGPVQLPVKFETAHDSDCRSSMSYVRWAALYNVST